MTLLLNVFALFGLNRAKKHNSCLHVLRTEELTNKNVLVTPFQKS